MRSLYHDLPRTSRARQMMTVPVTPETYSRAVRRVPLLSREEERDLAYAIWNARRAVWQAGWQDVLAVTHARAMLKDIEDAPPEGWSADDVADWDTDEVVLSAVKDTLERQGHAETLSCMERRHRELNLLKQRLARANLRLVFMVARRLPWQQIGWEDAVAEGNLGLLRAVVRFDPRKSCRFSTYATWWIRHKISRAVSNQARTVRTPVHAQAKVRKMHRLESQALVTRGAPPCEDEFAAALGCSVDTIRRLQTISIAPAIPLDPLARTDDENPCLLERLADSGPSPSEAAGAEQMIGKLYQALGTLTGREQEIVERRYGLLGHARKAQTLAQVARALDLSRERVRQIEREARAKLHARLAGTLG